MAGMDWFRWHHGAVTDPKFQLVARKSGASLPVVLAVWAYVLESASQSADRGSFDIDAEALDCLFALDDGTTAKVLAAMGDRGLIADGHVSSWDKRQPKRERGEDEGAAERKRRQRERDNTEPADALNVTADEAKDNHVTPSHATSRQVTPRGEESRGEEEKSSTSSSAASLPTCPHREVIALFGKHLPYLPQPKPELWDGQRAKDLTARWRWLLTKTKQSGERYATNPAEALAWFDRFFAYVAQSDFLTGRAGSWACDLGWLVKAENFAKVVQGNYENKEREAA